MFERVRIPRGWWFVAIVASILMHSVGIGAFFLIPEEKWERPRVAVDTRIDSEDPPQEICFCDSGDMLTPKSLVAKKEPLEKPPEQAIIQTSSQQIVTVQPKSEQPNIKDSRPVSNGTSTQQGKNSLALHGRVDQAGVRVLYIIDRSGSMGIGGKLETACAMVQASYQQLGSEVSFQILGYHSSAKRLLHSTTGDYQRSTEDTQRLADLALQKLIDEGAEGTSNHAIALREGISLRPDVVILITDHNAKREDIPTIDERISSPIFHVVILQKGVARGCPNFEAWTNKHRGKVIRIEE